MSPDPREHHEFDNRIKALITQISREYELEYRKRLEDASNRCQQLEKDNKDLVRKLDLYKRQHLEYAKAHEQIKSKASNAQKAVQEHQRQDSTNAHFQGQSEQQIIQNLQSVIAFISDTATRTVGARSNSAEAQQRRVPPQLPATAGQAGHSNENVHCLETGDVPSNGPRIPTEISPPETVYLQPEPAVTQHNLPTQASSSGRPGIIRSSQSTEDGEDLEATQIKDEPDCHSSSPTVTAVRTVKREKGISKHDHHAGKQQLPLPRYNGTLSKPFVIKEEPGSSPPEVLRATQIANPPIESLDLDEVNELVHTPHKRRRLAEQFQARLAGGFSVRQASHLGYDRAQSLPSTVPANGCFSENLSPRAATSRSPRGARRFRNGMEPEAPTTPLANGEALARMSDNEQNKLQQRVQNSTIGRKRRRADPQKVQALGEDGESLPSASQVVPNGDAPKGQPGSARPLQNDAGAHKRLENLLDDLPMEKTALLPVMDRAEQTENRRAAILAATGSTTKFARSNKQGQGRGWFNSSTRVSPSKTKHAKEPNKQVARSSDEQGRQRSMSPSEEPLRARPVDKLKLTDFRINPEFNDGRKFAFAEVVRKQVERKCLPGCTDVRCCGGRFRALAKMGISPGGSGATRRSFMEATPSQEETLPEGVADTTELALLERHLGSGLRARQRIAQMTAEELCDSLLEAKTAALANDFGRHRQRFERAASPDEFWETDFPSTQKVKASKEQALKSERDKVAARHREAIKGREGRGRFLFRDE